jgi:hypothetical protein
MTEFEQIIQDLQSDDLETRYNACKQLQAAPQLSTDGIEALRAATNDIDPLVALSACRALVAHDESFNSIIQLPPAQWAAERYSPRPTYLYQYKLPQDNFLRNIFVSGSALIAFISSFSLLSRSPGYTEASIWVPLAPILLIFSSLGSAIAASIVSLAMTSRMRGRMKNQLIFVTSMITGLIIGIFTGFICNIW